MKNGIDINVVGEEMEKEVELRETHRSRVRPIHLMTL
jgi:hypothetical protein